MSIEECGLNSSIFCRCEGEVMAKQKSLCESRGLAKAIGWSHGEVLNYLDEECIPFKKVKRGAFFPASMIERDMWAAYKANILSPKHGGRGKKPQKKFRGSKKRGVSRRKKGAYKRRVSRTKKRHSGTKTTSRKTYSKAKKPYFNAADIFSFSKKHAHARGKKRNAGAKKRVTKKGKSKGSGFDIKKILWFWQ